MPSDEQKSINRGEQLLALRKLTIPTITMKDGRIAGSTLKLVLRAIDDHGEECWAAVQTIAKETCLTARSVQRAIRGLRQFNFITIEERTGQSSVIRIDWKTIEAPGIEFTPEGNSPPNSICTPPKVMRPTPEGNAQTPEGNSPKARRSESETKKKRERARPFVPPTLEEVRHLWAEEKLNGNPDAFFHHKQANGWTHSKGTKSLSRWKDAARYWSANEESFRRPTGRTANTGPGAKHDPKRKLVHAKF